MIIRSLEVQSLNISNKKYEQLNNPQPLTQIDAIMVQICFLYKEVTILLCRTMLQWYM